MEKVILKIDKVLEDKGFSKSRLASEANLQYKQAEKYCSGDVKQLDLKVLAQICNALNCTISDIIEYKR